MEWQIEGLSALPAIAKRLLENYPALRIFALTGEVGAGKTTLIQQICRHLGVTSVVSSPTFGIVNEYFYDDVQGNSQSVYHLDLYRLRSIEEALDIGVEEYLYSTAYCFIEWPALIEPLLPEDTLRIHLEIVSDSQRKMLIL